MTKITPANQIRVKMCVRPEGGSFRATFSTGPVALALPGHFLRIRAGLFRVEGRPVANPGSLSFSGLSIHAALRYLRLMDFLKRYATTTNGVVALMPGPDKLAHLGAGVVIWLLAALVFRRSLGSVLPLVVVILLESGNEVLDRLHYGSWRWPDTISDFVATVLIPLLFTLAIRRFPFLRATP